MSAAKNRKNNLQEQYGESFPHWYYWLTAHALTHAGIVILLTGNYLFAILETISHWLIDYAKCEKWINIHQDQIGHMVFKVIYCVIFYYSLTL